jgi:hypothetical protein
MGEVPLWARNWEEEDDDSSWHEEHDDYEFHVPNIHHDYAEDVRLGHLEKIFAKLSVSHQLDDGTIKDIVEKTGVNKRTLETWRRKLIHDPSWRPYRNRNIHRRLLTPEQEEWLATEIRSEFIDKQRYCPGKQLTRMAMRIKYGLEGPGTEEEEVSDAEEAVPEEIEFPEEEDESKPREEFTAKWRRAFLKRHNLSLRRARTERRTMPDDEIVAQFLSQIQEAVSVYGRSRVFNMDETSVQVIKTSLKTIAPRGSESVKVSSRSSPKKNLTVIATISADGAKLPPMVVCKGKTIRCEAKIRSDFAGEIQRKELFVTHSPQGWVNHDVARQYLDSLRSYTGSRGPLVLVWDVFTSHRDNTVVAHAFERGIQLIFVPAGQTGTYQPLDLRVFGELKRKIDQRFDHQHMIDPNVEESPSMAVKYMLDSWGSITQENVLKAWEPII